MGKKPAARQPSPMWVTTADLPTSAGHPFFERLNRVLEEAGFDAFVEGLCAVFYASRLGRPSLRPGRYFRLLFIGYFEGLSSERGIAWRVADSLSLRAFLDLDVTEAPPNHSTLSRTRRLILLARMHVAGTAYYDGEAAADRLTPRAAPCASAAAREPLRCARHRGPRTGGAQAGLRAPPAQRDARPADGCRQAPIRAGGIDRAARQLAEHPGLAVSERMTAYWAERRKKAAKK